MSRLTLTNSWTPGGAAGRTDVVIHSNTSLTMERRYNLCGIECYKYEDELRNRRLAQAATRLLTCHQMMGSDIRIGRRAVSLSSAMLASATLVSRSTLHLRTL